MKIKGAVSSNKYKSRTLDEYSAAYIQINLILKEILKMYNIKVSYRKWEDQYLDCISLCMKKSKVTKIAESLRKKVPDVKEETNMEF